MKNYFLHYILYINNFIRVLLVKDSILYDKKYKYISNFANTHSKIQN